MTSEQIGQCLELTRMDRDNSQRSFHQGQKHCMIDGFQHPSFTENTMHGDTASSCHLTNDDSGMFDVVIICAKVRGIGGSVIATKKGKKRYRYICEDGSSVEIVLDPMKFSKDGTSLFAITSELSKGAKISNNVQNDQILTYPDG